MSPLRSCGPAELVSPIPHKDGRGGKGARHMSMTVHVKKLLDRFIILEQMAGWLDGWMGGWI